MKWLPIRNIFIYLCLIYMGGKGGMKGWKERGRVKGASRGERSAHSMSPSFWLVKTSINWVCGSVSVRSATRASASPGCSEIWSISLRRQIRWEKISILLSSKKQNKKAKKKKETTLAVKINKILRQYRSDQRNIRNSDCFQTGF